jgi:hypothetical protein
LDASFIDEYGITRDQFSIVKESTGETSGPRLVIRPTDSPEELELSWPDTLLPFHVEQRTAESADREWRRMTNTPAASSHRRRILMNPAEDSQWFRLRSEP